MPPTASRTRPRVPIGVFLAAGCQSNRRPSQAGRLPSWHGATPAAVASIIRTYTADGDLIVDLDAHPAVTAAAWFLHRVPATLTTGRDSRQLRVLPPPPDQPAPPRDAPAAEAEAALVLVTLPRPDLSGSPAGLARGLQRWRTLLRPGGFVIVTLTGEWSLRSDVIAATPGAGLRWQQQLLTVTRLPATEPRAEAQTSPVDAALAGGRHARTHHTSLVFVTAEYPEAHHG